MAKKLKVHVHAVERDDQGNTTNSGTFGPDDDLSKPENAWVEKAISNPDVWEDGQDDEPAAQPEPARRSPGRPAAPTK
jgi:hypothetical protein